MVKRFLGKKDDDGFDPLSRLWYYLKWFYLFTAKKVWDWFRYRFIPKHRYHTIRLHDPGYCDPSSQVLYAVMAVVERYVQELRINANFFFDKDLSAAGDVEVLNHYIRAKRQAVKNGDLREVSWLNHYIKIRSVVFWWNNTKDDPELDIWSERDVERWANSDVFSDDINPEEYKHLTIDFASSMLKTVIDARDGMWV